MGPWHVLAPHPAVRAEDGAEGAELEPAGIELARLRNRMEEATDVGAPVRHAREAGVEPEGDLRLERGEVVADIARPARRSEPLHPRRARAAEQKDALIGAVGRLAVGECLVAEAVVDIVEQRAVAAVEPGRRRRTFAAVEPPAGNPELDQLSVGRPPPGADGRVGKVEVSLALAIVGAPTGCLALARPAIPLLEQISLGLGLGKE